MRRFRLLILFAIVLAGGLLRFETLGAKCLWLDEIIAWRLNRYPPAELIARMRHPFEGSPPLYNLMMSFWSAIAGDSEWSLRAPAALAGTLSIVGVYAFVWELAAFERPKAARRRGRNVATPALLAAAMMAGSVMQIFTARQARMYSWGAALLAWAAWSLFKALRSRRPGAYWMLYAVLALAACYTHALPLLTVFAQLLFVAVLLAVAARQRWLGQRPAAWGRIAREGRWRWALVAAVLIAIGYAPWGLAFRAKVAQSARNYWMPPLRINDCLRQMFELFFGPFPATDTLMEWGGLAAVIVLAVALFQGARRGGWAGIYLLVTGIVPVALIAVHAVSSGHSLFQSRYLTFIHLDWLAAVALLVGRMPRPGRTTVVAYGFAIWIFVLMPPAWRLVGPAAEPGMRAAMAFVAAHRRPGEPLLTQNGATFIEVSYYGRDGAEPRYVVADPDRQHQVLAPYLNDADLISRGGAARGVEGLWWVSSTAWGNPRGLPAWFPGKWESRGRREFTRDYWWRPEWSGPVVVEHFVRHVAGASHP